MHRKLTLAYRATILALLSLIAWRLWIHPTTPTPPAAPSDAEWRRAAVDREAAKFAARQAELWRK